MNTLTKRLTLVIGAAVLLIGLPACSAASSQSAEGATAEGGSNTVTDENFSAERDKYDLKLAGCLRDKGFDVKDPRPGEGITEDSPEIREAASVCMAELGDPPTPAIKPGSPEYEKQQRAFISCLRERGNDVTEPKQDEALSIPESVTDEDLAACDLVA
ncbi:hypothetical protein QBL02_04030 [Leucobacter sp. UT-8R-CII-1-4]|uniref:hypothetical protein n=1 Tax=Leucobacter sp. UT-8R-CII-1-4 TaxID=3040075 RepID=UPI0024A88C20|nr:hypothetical protein [Leucobacter sp. UT-8R-CII-1-4]MDI6022709.1 hypothetical protein [Leucobacter sp. UT-8R-CII-1-4]